MQTIWQKNEISVADELVQATPTLISEFLAYHDDYFDHFVTGQSYFNAEFDTQNYMSHRDAWKVAGLKYVLPMRDLEINLWQNSETKNRFPCAVALMEKYQQHCGCCGYSSLDAKSSIKPHCDIENLDRKYVRIHLPLLVPPGDCFIQIGDVKMSWTEIFAFDNQTRHEAQNNTSSRRLIFIMDLTREFLGINPARQP